MELTKEQFCQEIEELNKKDMLFKVKSVDSGTVFLSLYVCKVEATLKDGIGGEIALYKPYTSIGVVLDFDIVDTITKEECGIYRVKFGIGMSDVTIRPIG